jgi:hypothetical protein
MAPRLHNHFILQILSIKTTFFGNKLHSLKEDSPGKKMNFMNLSEKDIQALFK